MELRSSIRGTRWAACGALMFAAACSSDKQEPRSAASVSGTAAMEQQASADDSATTVQISRDIRLRCNISEAPQDAPQFDYDRATLRPRGENVLDAVAECLRSGSLKGQTITLIGRADPRGTAQYNQSLGASRAAAARDYLVQRGVSASQISLVSRGEKDARGTNDQTWALDRRVDMELGTWRPSTTGEEPSIGSASGTASAESPILEGTRLQIQTSESRKDEHPNAGSYADTAEGGTPVDGSVGRSSGPASGSSPSGSTGSGTVQGSASGSVSVGQSR